MATKRSEFGRALAKLRIDRGMLLGDMASALDVSSAFLSAVEFGRKKIPDRMVDAVSNALNLNHEERTALAEAAVRTKKTFTLQLKHDATPEHSEIGAALARRFPDFNDKKLQILRELLEED